MNRNPFLNTRLFCPGPTPVPLSTAIAAVDASVYHRSEDFYKILTSCRQMLAPFFGTKHLPLILTSSGTGAMEAAVANLIQPGDSVLVLVGGKFGARWGSIAERYQAVAQRYHFNWGESPSLNELSSLLKQKPKAVFLQANETSTGVAYPVAAIADVIRKASPDTLMIVDGVSSLVAHEMRMDEWGIDVVLSGSQKGFGVPAGLSFIALSERAWKQVKPRSYYFDLVKERDNQNKDGTAYTPAIGLVLALHQALQLLQDFGPARCAQHHETLARACRKAVQAMNLSLFPRDHFSNALTAVEVPSAVMQRGLMKILKNQFKMIFAGGQDDLKGKIIRISHLGLMDPFDLAAGLSGLEIALQMCGHSFKMGAGMTAYLEEISQNYQFPRL